MKSPTSNKASQVTVAQRVVTDYCFTFSKKDWITVTICDATGFWHAMVIDPDSGQWRGFWTADFEERFADEEAFARHVALYVYADEPDGQGRTPTLRSRHVGGSQ